MKPLPTRQAFGDVLLEIGEENDKVYVIDSDISRSMKTVGFAEKFSDRHINVGIAEQNAAGVAAGLATMDMIPIISTYAVFGSMRMCEQIRTSVCYPKLNVKIACSHGGVTPCNDGVTHQAIEDMGIYRTIPNMTVIMPADYDSAKALIREMIDYDGPVYIRFTRDGMPRLYSKDEKFTIGKGKVLKEGSDVALIAIGDMVHQANKAAKLLEEQGISAMLIDMHTLKPLDEELVKDAINKCGKIVTIEDHNVLNGLGSAVSDIIAKEGKGMLRKIGLQDTFAESGPYDKLLEKYGMDDKAIFKAALDMK